MSLGLSPGPGTFVRRRSHFLLHRAKGGRSSSAPKAGTCRYRPHRGRRRRLQTPDARRAAQLAVSVRQVHETAKRLMTIPGVGPVTASAIKATNQDASAVASGREFAALLGLTAAKSISRSLIARLDRRALRRQDTSSDT